MTTLTERDIKDAERISDLFADMSEESKNVALGYLSALRDKEVIEQNGQSA